MFSFVFCRFKPKGFEIEEISHQRPTWIAKINETAFVGWRFFNSTVISKTRVIHQIKEKHTRTGLNRPVNPRRWFLDQTHPRETYRTSQGNPRGRSQRIKRQDHPDQKPMPLPLQLPIHLHSLILDQILSMYPDPVTASLLTLRVSGLLWERVIKDAMGFLEEFMHLCCRDHRLSWNKTI